LLPSEVFFFFACDPKDFTHTEPRESLLKNVRHN